MARNLDTVNAELADARYLLTLATEEDHAPEIVRLVDLIAKLESEQFGIEFAALTA